MFNNIINKINTLLKKSYNFYAVYSAISFVIIMVISLTIGMIGRNRHINETKEEMERASETAAERVTMSIEQYAAKITCNYTDNINDFLAAQHFQHGHSGGTLRFPVIGKTFRPVINTIAPAIMPCVMILFPAFLNKDFCFIFRVNFTKMTKEPGTFFHDFRFTAGCGDKKTDQDSQSSFGST